MKTTMLLGATKDNVIVFGEWEFHHPHLWSKEKENWVDKDVLEFSASFDTVRPFNGSECDLVDYFSSPELQYGKEQAYDLCEQYDCSPRDLAQRMAKEK